MHGTDRTLVIPPVSSRDAFAEIDARNAAKAKSLTDNEIEAAVSQLATALVDAGACLKKVAEALAQRENVGV